MGSMLLVHSVVLGAAFLFAFVYPDAAIVLALLVVASIGWSSLRRAHDRQ